MLVDFARDPSQTPMIRGPEFFNYLNYRKMAQTMAFYAYYVILTVESSPRGFLAVASPQVIHDSLPDPISSMMMDYTQSKGVHHHVRPPRADFTGFAPMFLKASCF
jgi:hypothetical protein